TVVFAGVVMLVSFVKGSQAFQPLVDVLDQAALVVGYIVSGGNVHGGNQYHPLLPAGFLHNRLNLGGDVDVLAMLLGMEVQVFGVYFHNGSSRSEQATVLAAGPRSNSIKGLGRIFVIARLVT